MNNKLFYINYFKYLIECFPFFFKKIKYNNGNISLYLKDNKNFIIISKFFKNHFNLKFKQLSFITATDYFFKKKRFEVSYFFLSLFFNSRISIRLNLADFESVESLNNIFQSSNWYEREVWDMFGIFFVNNFDLRRILTDYGFQGFPLRKDFPQTGFFELRYDDKKNYIIYESLELSQEYRFFQYNKTWNYL